MIVLGNRNHRTQFIEKIFFTKAVSKFFEDTVSSLIIVMTICTFVREVGWLCQAVILILVPRRILPALTLITTLLT